MLCSETLCPTSVTSPVLFCSAKVYLMKSPEVFPLQLRRLMIYSDSLRKLNALQRIISNHSASVLKYNGCTLPPVALVKSCCSEWRLRVRPGLDYSLFVLAEQLRHTFTAFLQGSEEPIENPHGISCSCLHSTLNLSYKTGLRCSNGRNMGQILQSFTST